MHTALLGEEGDDGPSHAPAEQFRILYGVLAKRWCRFPRRGKSPSERRGLASQKGLPCPSACGLSSPACLQPHNVCGSKSLPERVEEGRPNICLSPLPAGAIESKCSLEFPSMHMCQAGGKGDVTGSHALQQQAEPWYLPPQACLTARFPCSSCHSRETSTPPRQLLTNLLQSWGSPAPGHGVPAVLGSACLTEAVCWSGGDTGLDAARLVLSLTLRMTLGESFYLPVLCFASHPSSSLFKPTSSGRGCPSLGVCAAPTTVGSQSWLGPLEATVT